MSKESAPVERNLGVGHKSGALRVIVLTAAPGAALQVVHVYQERQDGHNVKRVVEKACPCLT